MSGLTYSSGTADAEFVFCGMDTEAGAGVGEVLCGLGRVLGMRAPRCFEGSGRELMPKAFQKDRLGISGYELNVAGEGD